jgi:hypothetical protein
MISIRLKVKSFPTDEAYNSSIWLDFYDDGSDEMMYPQSVADQSLIYENNIYQKLKIGTSVEASADLSALSLKSGTTDYIPSFAAATTAYTTNAVPYADNNGGLTLSYTAGVEYGVGKSRTQQRECVVRQLCGSDYRARRRRHRYVKRLRQRRLVNEIVRDYG